MISYLQLYNFEINRPVYLRSANLVKDRKGLSTVFFQRPKNRLGRAGDIPYRKVTHEQGDLIALRYEVEYPESNLILDKFISSVSAYF